VGSMHRSAYRRGTRVIRPRTFRRGGRPGQPLAPPTDPKRIYPSAPERHYCAECFGPRNRYQEGPFCARCERALFGDPRLGYKSFIRSERQRNIHRERRRRQDEAQLQPSLTAGEG
jgi:hypothetical protein